jgi:hypothetical protein
MPHQTDEQEFLTHALRRQQQRDVPGENTIGDDDRPATTGCRDLVGVGLGDRDHLICEPPRATLPALERAELPLLDQGARAIARAKALP